MRGTKMSANEAAETIDRLQRELYHSRQSIIDLMNEETRGLLMTLYGCRSREDAYAWGDDIIKTLVGRAAASQVSPGRAFCPLCKDGPQSGDGFALPEGLRRHLAGWSSSIRQCSVMEAAVALAVQSAESRVKLGPLPGHASPT